MHNKVIRTSLFMEQLNCTIIANKSFHIMPVFDLIPVILFSCTYVCSNIKYNEPISWFSKNNHLFSRMADKDDKLLIY